MSIFTQLQHETNVDPNRVQRAREIILQAALQVVDQGVDQVKALVNLHHTTGIERRSDGTLKVGCSCQDWKTRGVQINMPCKHILALAFTIDSQFLMNGVANGTATAPSQPPSPTAPQPSGVAVQPAALTFCDEVQQAIRRAITDLADQVQSFLAAHAIPFLIGPTGAGKTSAVRLCATSNGWGFEEVAGCQSFADADLVGLRTDKQELPGIFARTFRRARAGEQVLLFLDELTRFNVRAQDLLMRPLQVAPVEVVQAMGIASTTPLRLVEAPLWGVEYAPASAVYIVLAANPWGSALDPALLRRVEPIEVQMADAVAALFEQRLADAIRASWKSVDQGELPLPIEYQHLSTAQAPDDTRILQRYLVRLHILDRAAAEGYRHLLHGLGIAL
ncbi:MAG: AAA family ATPase [Caldilinea sp. CFX5]|nr:AAA family ATPase [Caldilinea sp. CFX5]